LAVATPVSKEKLLCPEEHVTVSNPSKSPRKPGAEARFPVVCLPKPVGLLQRAGGSVHLGSGPAPAEAGPRRDRMRPLRIGLLRPCRIGKIRARTRIGDFQTVQDDFAAVTLSAEICLVH
jgi:hypothetical protein